MGENDLYLLTNGNNGCDISYEKIKHIADVVKGYYHFSSPMIWMWKMFQIGYAYGKRKERAKKRGDSNASTKRYNHAKA